MATNFAAMLKWLVKPFTRVEESCLWSSTKQWRSVLQRVSNREYQAFQRKRLGRGVVLLVLALIPVVTLLRAGLSTEPGAICGS